MTPRARLLAAGAGCHGAALAGLALAVAQWVVALAVANGPLTGIEVDAARVLGFVAVGAASMAAVLGFAWLTRGVRLAT